MNLLLNCRLRNTAQRGTKKNLFTLSLTQMRSPSPKKMKEDTPTDSVKKPSGRAPLRQKAVEPKHVAFVAIAFCTYLVFLYSIYRMLPELPDEHKHKLTLPFSVEAAQDLREVLLIYVEEAYLGTLIGGFFFYVFLQTFSIPGSAFLNFIAGAVFGVPVAFITTLLAATFGASFSYLLSYYIGSGIVRATFPDMMVLFATHLNKHRQHLFNYLLFLRLTPFLPNWFINLASPILSVPFKTFFLATFFGTSIEDTYHLARLMLSILKF